MWKTIATDTTPDGHAVELRMGVFGKGKSQFRKWEMFRDGVKVGYATTDSDVQANWDQVCMGRVRNPETGQYEPAAD